MDEGGSGEARRESGRERERTEADRPPARVANFQQLYRRLFCSRLSSSSSAAVQFWTLHHQPKGITNEERSEEKRREEELVRELTFVGGDAIRRNRSSLAWQSGYLRIERGGLSYRPSRLGKSKSKGRQEEDR